MKEKTGRSPSLFTRTRPFISLGNQAARGKAAIFCGRARSLREKLCVVKMQNAIQRIGLNTNLNLTHSDFCLSVFSKKWETTYSILYEEVLPERDTSFRE